MGNKIKRFNENLELNTSEVSDASKSLAIEFANWIADNKWYRQTKYDSWEKSGESIKSSSQLFDLFINN